MKKIFTVMLAFVGVLACAACAKAPAEQAQQPASPAQSQATKQESAMNKKVLVAYFSQSGNTAAVARQIAQKTGGDLYRIETQTPYPSDYGTLLDQAKQEIRSGAKPALKGNLPPVQDYDVIFIGSPNWWGTHAPALSSFVAQSNLQGKTVVPFFTHGGGGMQNCERDLKKQLSGATVAQGAAFPGRASGASESALEEWLAKLGF